MYYHMVDAPFQPFRLIWIADMVSLVERFADQIDWERATPRLRNALAAIRWLTPFGLVLPENAKLIPELPPNQKAAQLLSWPLSVTPARCQDEYLRNIPKAFNPSVWWLRFYYGLGAGRALGWARVWHPLHLLGWVARYRHLSHIIRRVGEYCKTLF